MLNLDTHIVLFMLTDNLTRHEQTLVEEETCGISQIVLWEIANLSLLGRINMSLEDQDLAELVEELREWPVSMEVCRRLRDLDFDSDPADEIIAATSLAHGVPLLTRDKHMRKSKVVPLA
jgi:PIN domain nuclease of toxin-antitoxin system